MRTHSPYHAPDGSLAQTDRRLGPGGPNEDAAIAPIPKLGYQPALDGLRAIAIGLVLAEHTGLWIFDGGRNGVIVFFVLSGFLITKLMIEEWDRSGGLDIRSFYARRTIRIMPAPLVMLALMYLLRGQYTPEGPVRDYFLVELALAGLYLTNLRPLWGGVPPGIDRLYLAHTWSLAVEEHFYLVWPWLVRWLRLPARPPRSVIRGLLVFAGVVTVARAVAVAVVPDLVSFSLFSFDAFAIGGALAFALHHRIGVGVLGRLMSPRVFWLGVGVVAVDLLVGEWSHDIAYAYYTYIGLASAVMIGHLALNRDSLGHRLLSLAPVVYAGKLSYSVYLWHVPIQNFVTSERYPDWSLWQLLAVEWAVTILVSLASYHVIELPLVALRKRFVAGHRS